MKSLGEKNDFSHTCCTHCQHLHVMENPFKKSLKKMTPNRLKSRFLASLFWAFFFEGVPIHHFSPLGYRKTVLEVFFGRLGRF